MHLREFSYIFHLITSEEIKHFNDSAKSNTLKLKEYFALFKDFTIPVIENNTLLSVKDSYQQGKMIYLTSDLIVGKFPAIDKYYINTPTDVIIAKLCKFRNNNNVAIKILL